ncbi:MAG: P-loop NTPase [Actinobacteria bacterium]|nr:P-loop NTPase [Actinomycetota bacterium]
MDTRTLGASNAVGPSISIRIAVVEPDSATRTRLAMQLGETVGAFPSTEALVSQLNGSPVIAVLGPSCARSPGFGGAEEHLLPRPEIGAILISDELTTELFQRAIRAGVRDVLAAPVETAQLGEAVRRVAESLETVARGVASAAAAEAAEGEQGHVITVFSTKGGAGKSVVAVNLAVSLALRSDRPVVIVDCDLQFGDVTVMLKMAPPHTIVDAVQAVDRLDPNLLNALLATHQPTGLRVLPAPLEPAYADQISAAAVSKIIGMLRNTSAYIVVDTPSYFDDKVISLIEESDDIVLVAGMDIPNIKNVKIGLQTMQLLDTPMSKIHLILNRSNSKVKLDIGEVERTLGVKAEAFIPSDIVVPQSVNKGNPVVLDAPKTGVAKALEQLADTFAPQRTKKR